MIATSLQIPGYDIEELLGKGGMASVYRARQQSFGREVALKVLHPGIGDGNGFSERFVQESLIVAKLHHSHIVQLYDVGQHEDMFYITMEYLHGDDLGKKLASGLAIKDTLTIIKQLASALDFAHRKHIIHRDIKPENVMFREDGAAVLTDFGIAKELESQTNLTQTGFVIGTPKYMSPEQIRGEDVDHRADLYALGIVFFRCLTNYVPFDGKDMVVTSYLQHYEPVPELPEDVACFQPIINRMLAKEPADRYQRGMDIVEALEDLDRRGYAPYLTNLDVAASCKLSPPTVTRSSSGNHSAQTPRYTQEYDAPDFGRRNTRPDGTRVRRQLPRQRIVAPLRDPTRTTPMPWEIGQRQAKKESRLNSLLITIAFACVGLFFVTQLWSDQVPEYWSALWDRATSMMERKLDESAQPAAPSSDLPLSELPEEAGQRLVAEGEATVDAGQNDPSTGVETSPEGASQAASSQNEGTATEPPVERSEPSVAQQIEELLVLAAEDIKKWRFTTPRANNAYEKYQQVLALDADNEAALTGIRHIAEEYVKMAEQAIKRQQYEVAGEHLDKARSVAPDLAAIEAVDDKLFSEREAYREQQAMETAMQQEELITKLLLNAAKDEEAGRIRSPVGYNAVEKYLLVLELDPDNSKAIEKLVELGR